MLPLRDRVSALLAELQHEKEVVARQGIPPNRAAAALQTTLDTTATLHEKKRERLASRFVGDGRGVDTRTSMIDVDEGALSAFKVFRDVCTHCKRTYWSTTAEERASHPFKCAYRPVKCVGCGEGLRAKHAKEHVCRI